jgi:hypothetical protein
MTQTIELKSEWRTTQNKRVVYYPYAERIFRAALNAQVAPFIAEMTRTGIMQWTLITATPMQRAYDVVYVTVGTAFAADAYQALAKSENQAFELKRRRRRFVIQPEVQTTWINRIKRFVRDEVADRITSVTRTTIETVKRSIDNSLLEGLGTDEAARELRKQWKVISLNRAKVISRTEILSASNAGGFIGAQSTGLDLMKVWLSTRDGRTRDAHLHVDGEAALMEETFSNGLRYPGDPRGSAAQTVQCRCTQTFKPVEE